MTELTAGQIDTLIAAKRSGLPVALERPRNQIGPTLRSMRLCYTDGILTVAGEIVASQAERMRELETENARLREALEQASKATVELVSALAAEYSRRGATAPHFAALEAFQATAKELLG